MPNSVPHTAHSTKSAPSYTDNAKANRVAMKQLSDLELATGKPAEYWAAFHAENRARVLARYGLDQRAAS